MSRSEPRAPAPAPVEPPPFLDLTAEPEPVAPTIEPAPAASTGEPDIDLTSEPATEPVPPPAAREVVVPEIVVPEVVGRRPRVVVPEIVGDPVPEPHRSNGNGNAGDVVDERPPATPVEILDAPVPEVPPSVELPAETRAVRVKTVKVNGKRRWVVDVLVRQEEPKPEGR